jgi:uncharacterized phage-associated protein
MKPYQSLTIANWFIKKGYQENIFISLMKLQKLLYYAHGMYLASTNKPLLCENIFAGDYDYEYHKESYFPENEDDEQW